MEVSFEHRSPAPDDVIRIGMVDLEENDRWIDLGESVAWNWQQGCMLQWVPGAEKKVLWNDRRDGRFVCHILDVATGERGRFPPVYSVSPDGKSAVTADFRRIASVRPGYGYAGLEDPRADQLAPEDSGIEHVDLETGRSRLILSVAEIARMGKIPENDPAVKHYFNHLLFSPDGSRFIALHRWRYPDGRRLTRLLTARPDGSDVRIVIPNGYASHFIWRVRGTFCAVAALAGRGELGQLPVRRPRRQARRADRPRRARLRRPSELPAGQGVDSERHLSEGKSGCKRRTSTTCPAAGGSTWAISIYRRRTAASGVDTHPRLTTRGASASTRPTKTRAARCT